VSRSVDSFFLALTVALALVLSSCATVPGGPQGPAMRLAGIMSDVYVTAMLERLFAPGDPRDTARYLVGREGDKMQRVEQMLAGRYADAFTEAELTELVAFFDSPLGRKVQATYSSVFYEALAEPGRPGEVQRRMGQRLGARFKAAFSVAELRAVKRFYASPLGKKWRSKGQEIDRALFADEDIRVLRRVAEMECLVEALTPEVRSERVARGDPQVPVAVVLGQKPGMIAAAEVSCTCAVNKLVGKTDVKKVWQLSATKRAKQRAQILASGACQTPTGSESAPGRSPGFE
jgi:hypothetical protein